MPVLYYIFLVIKTRQGFVHLWDQTPYLEWDLRDDQEKGGHTWFLLSWYDLLFGTQLFVKAEHVEPDEKSLND